MSLHENVYTIDLKGLLKKGSWCWLVGLFVVYCCCCFFIPLQYSLRYSTGSWFVFAR